MTDSESISLGYDQDPSRSSSLRAEAYTEDKWFDADLRSVLSKTWQWVCHVEKTREPGSFVTVEIAGLPIAVVRDILKKGETIFRHWSEDNGRTRTSPRMQDEVRVHCRASPTVFSAPDVPLPQHSSQWVLRMD